MSDKIWPQRAMPKSLSAILAELKQIRNVVPKHHKRQDADGYYELWVTIEGEASYRVYEECK